MIAGPAETLAEDELFLMVNMRGRSTGLPINIWIGPRGHARHAARIKVQQDHSERFDIDNLAVVSIEDEPPRVVAGNPGGRPRAAQDIQALAREHTPAAIAALVDALASPRERVQAAVALLDRAWGKPVSHIGGDPDGNALLIDFRWADGPSDSTPAPAPEPAAVNGFEPTAEIIVAWAGDEAG